jgi:hypothetical protein
MPLVASVTLQYATAMFAAKLDVVDSAISSLRRKLSIVIVLVSPAAVAMICITARWRSFLITLVVTAMC